MCWADENQGLGLFKITPSSRAGGEVQQQQKALTCKKSLCLSLAQGLLVIVSVDANLICHPNLTDLGGVDGLQRWSLLLLLGQK